MREDDQGQDQDRVNSSFFQHQNPPTMCTRSIGEAEMTENCIERVRAFSQKPQESLSKSAFTTNTSRSSKKSSKSMFNYLWSFLIVILAVFLNVQMAFGLAETEGFVTESDLMGPVGEYVTTPPPAPAYHQQNHQIFAKGSTTPRAHRGSNGHSDHIKHHGVPYEGKSPGLAHWREKYMLMNESLSHDELKKELQKEKKVPPISAMKPQPRSTTSTTTSTTTKATTTTQSPPFPGLVNETREALQEGESHHQPIVFVGGAGLQGFIPPSNLRARPLLGADTLDPLWNQNPYGVDARFPAPLQSAWDRNYRNPFNMTRVQHIEAECQDDFMKIRVAFNGSFNGLVYSSGYSYDPDCIYVNGTGGDYYEYLIRLNRCGTLGARNHAEGRKEPSVSKMFNTITIQYNPMIEEEWDEHFKVTCEYGYDFWKTVTFPFLDVEVATGNPVVFTLTPPECHMEIRYGFGATGQRVGGPVRVGDPLTLMINMRSQYDGFDIVVNDCYAHNGATKKIQLIDHYGCPVDSKLMSPFRGTWTHTNVYETQVYAYLKTFRFTGSPALYIECDVRMCHGHCPSQPCYWRNIKHVNKRSIDDKSDKISNSSLSENISLFQALRVLQEDEDVSDSQKSEVSSPESVCIKSGTLSALIGAGTLIFVLLGMILMVMCFRLRRFKNIRETESTSDILRPYSHHASQWSSTSSLAKPQRILP